MSEESRLLANPGFVQQYAVSGNDRITGSPCIHHEKFPKQYYSGECG